MKTCIYVLEAFGQPLAYKEVEVELPDDDEILVEIVASGICQSDISMMDPIRGKPLPMVFGHEGTGFVKAVGSSVNHVKVSLTSWNEEFDKRQLRTFQPGDKVVLSFGHCQSCSACYNGSPYDCQDYRRMNMTNVRANGKAPWEGLDQATVHNFIGQGSFSRHMLVHKSSVRSPMSVNSIAKTERALAIIQGHQGRPACRSSATSSRCAQIISCVVIL